MQKPQTEGTIFINKFKDKDTQPDWTGKLEFNKDLLKQLVNVAKEGGEPEVRIALWNRTSKQGNEYKYLRMDLQESKDKRVKENVEVKQEPVQQAQESSGGSNFEDEIPF